MGWREYIQTRRQQALNDPNRPLRVGGVSGYSAGFNPDILVRAGAFDNQYKADYFNNMSTDLRNKQMQQANDFRKNMGGYRDRLQNLAGQQANSLRAQDVRDVNAAANSRGLLYSGFRQAGVGQAGAKRAAELSQNNMKINENLEGMAQEMENDALNTSFHKYRGDLDAADAAYNQALDRMKSRNSMTGALFSAGGAALGGYLGRKG